MPNNFKYGVKVLLKVLLGSFFVFPLSNVKVTGSLEGKNMVSILYTTCMHMGIVSKSLQDVHLDIWLLTKVIDLGLGNQ